MNSAKLKETIANIVKEESEYQVFFRKALEKAGKSIPSMSDEEKKAFFNKIDAAWDGKGEKNESLVGNQHKLDVDGDGEIEASDLAALRAGKKKDESVNEAPTRRSSDFFEDNSYGNSLHKMFKGKFDGSKFDKWMLAIEKKFPNDVQFGRVLDFIGGAVGMNIRKYNNLPVRKFISDLKSEVEKLYKLHTESVNEVKKGSVVIPYAMDKHGEFIVDKVFKNKHGETSYTGKFKKSGEHREFILHSKDRIVKESVNEGVSPKDMEKIKGAVEAASSFMGIGSELKKTGLRYIFATSPMPVYIVQPTPNNKVAIVNKKYATKPDFVIGDTAVGVMESLKKVNEEEIKWNAVENAIINFLKMNTKILDKRVKDRDTDGVKSGLKSIISGLTNAQRNLKLESVNEEIKVGQMVKVVNNPYWEAALGKKGPFKRKVKGIYGDSVFFTDGSNSDMKYIKEDAAVNEGVKLSLVDPNTNKFIKTLSLDRTYREAEKEIETLNRRLSPSQKTKGLYWKVTSIGESVNEYSVNKKFGSKYDIGAGSMGNGTTFWNRAEEEFGDYKKIAHVSDNGVVKFYDKTLPSNVKKHIEDYAKTQKESVNEVIIRKGTKIRMYLNGKSDIIDYVLEKPNYYNAVKGGKTNLFKVINSTTSKVKVGSTQDFSTTDLKSMIKSNIALVLVGESVNEGRAFINAARKAKAEGKTEFEFNGKKYPVTLKERPMGEKIEKLV
jgi:hypothetical protein